MGRTRAQLLTARVGVDLPVLVEWATGEEDGEDGGDKAADDETEADEDHYAMFALKAGLFLLAGSSQHRGTVRTVRRM